MNGIDLEQFQFDYDLTSPKITRPLGDDQRQNCLHCHNVYDGLHDLIDDQPDYDPRKLWKYPLPRNIGLRMDVTEGSRIVEVFRGSPAEAGGLKVGDDLRQLGGQAILSIADIQFVLHFLTERVTVPATVRRGDETIRTKLELREGWRAGDMSWRGSMWNLPPGPGLWTVALSATEKAGLSIPDAHVQSS